MGNLGRRGSGTETAGTRGDTQTADKGTGDGTGGEEKSGGEEKGIEAGGGGNGRRADGNKEGMGAAHVGDSIGSEGAGGCKKAAGNGNSSGTENDGSGRERGTGRRRKRHRNRQKKKYEKRGLHPLLLEPRYARYLVEICRQFLAGIPRGQIAENVTKLLQEKGINIELNREQVYQLIEHARKLGYFVLRPPVNEELQQLVAKAYGKRPHDITVVDAEGCAVLDEVTERAAVIVLDLVYDVARKKVAEHCQPIVEIGLTAGATTMRVAKILADGLRERRYVPGLVLHALTPGFKADDPSTDPVSFFGHFHNLPTTVEYMALYAPPMVESQDYFKYCNEARCGGVTEAFSRKWEIDILITSLASAFDTHGDLRQFLELGKADIDLLMELGWIGDVQYRPYTATGPMPQEASVRAVTLFELFELVTFAGMRNKHAMLVCGPCGKCGNTRADALRPLLSVPQLKVWTDVVMDRETAESLLVQVKQPGARTERGSRQQHPAASANQECEETRIPRPAPGHQPE